MPDSVTRRNLLCSAALIPPALTLLTAQSSRASESASPLSAEEKTNVATISTFLKLWGEPIPDPVKLAGYMTEDCIVRIGDEAPAIGKAKTLEFYRSILPAGTRYDIRIKETFARGPVVTNYRTDYMVKNGKPDNGLRVTAVFSLKDGHIKEWYEYDIGPP
jgi:limonene-1,2-epoxide hydrolase